MKNTIKFTISMMLVIMLSSANIKSLNVGESTYQAYLSGSMNLWERSVELAREEYESTKSNKSEFNLLKAEYGLLNATLKDQDEEIFDQYIDGAYDRGKKLADSEDYSAESKAILSGLTGMKIAYSPWKGMFLGSKSSSLITDAINEKPDSPIVQQLFGNYKNFTPETWGGDPETAIEAYKKAIHFHEESGLDNNWMYLDAHAWLGILKKNQGEEQEARDIWMKALDIEPDFGWVKFNLLPTLDN